MSIKIKWINYCYLFKNYDEAKQKLQNELIKKHNKELIKKFKSKAESELINIIRSNPGIIQTEIYNYFDDLYKSTIRNVLNKLESNGKIKKSKKGNSFELYLNTGETK